MSYSNKRRSSSSEDEGGGANWMDTYGDLVTLLLCFFVLLFAFSSIDKIKWQALVSAFAGTPTMTIQPIDPSQAMSQPITLMPRTEDAESQEESQQLFELYQDIKEYLNENKITAELSVNYETLVILMRFDEKVFFESGKADVLPDAFPMLDALADILSLSDDKYSKIRIEGHTDNVPINTAEFKNNWRLSGARALNVHEYLVIGTGKIAPERSSATGYGEYSPVGDNSTPEGRAENRRVDFFIEGVKAEED